MRRLLCTLVPLMTSLALMLTSTANAAPSPALSEVSNAAALSDTTSATPIRGLAAGERGKAGTQVAGVRVAGWRGRFGKTFTRKVNARQWDWVDRHSKNAVEHTAKDLRSNGRLRLLGDCGSGGKGQGYCYYRNGFLLTYKRANGSVIAEGLFLAN